MMDRLTFLAGNRVRIKTNSVEKLARKLAEYEDLEERLNGVSVKEIVNGFIKTVKNQTNEEYEHGRILTNTEADKWNEYKRLEEQGLLLRLPCKVGTTIYSIANNGKIYPVKATREVRIVNDMLHIICESCNYSDLVSYDDIGKTVFLTKAEAEQKLKEMFRENKWTDIYIKRGYDKAIDDFVKEICKMIVQSENNGNYRFYAVEIKQAIADIAEQLKAGVKE